MSVPKVPGPAKLVVGVFTGEKKILADVAEELVAEFGEPDLVSPWMSFDYTSYYEAEMGGALARRMFSFETLISQDELSAIKLATNRIEKKYMNDDRRIVNIDPGYMMPSRFVLATGKDFAHRLYIGSGIYADLTLLYKGGGFCSLPWTYPDYKEKNMHLFLDQVRKKYFRDSAIVKSTRPKDVSRGETF